MFHRTVDEEQTELLNNLMHWGYGSGWGSAYGLVHGTFRRRVLRPVLLFGAVVWSTSLVHLPAMNLSPPVWECPPAQLASDADFHLTHGAATAATYATLGG